MLTWWGGVVPNTNAGPIVRCTNAMKNRLGWVALLALGSLSSCGGQAPAGAKGANGAESAGATPGSSGKPFDFDATLKREASGLTEQAVEGPQAAWTAKVPAAAAPKLTPSENVMLVDIPIGSESAVRCQVFSDTLDPGGTLSGVIKESGSRVEYRSIVPSGVQVLSGVPATFLETVYVTDTEGGKGAGGLKLAIQVREQESLLCLHDEVGYKQTFKDISTAFFSTFKVRNAPANENTFTEVSKARLGDTDVGFAWTRVKPGQNPGEREYNCSNTTLIPTSPKDVIFEDSYEMFLYDRKNVLQTGTWVEGTGGEITLKVTIKRWADGKYAYEGEASGKPIKGVLPAPKGVLTSLEIATRLKKKLKAGAPFELVLPEYHPSIDPTALIDVTYKRQKGDPARQVVVTMSDRTMTTEVDDDGIAKTAWFQVGKHRLSIERLKSEGHL